MLRHTNTDWPLIFISKQFKVKSKIFLSRSLEKLLKQDKTNLGCWFFQTFTSDLWTEGKIAMLSNNLARASLPLRQSFTAGKQTIPLQQSFSKKLLLYFGWELAYWMCQAWTLHLPEISSKPGAWTALSQMSGVTKGPANCSQLPSRQAVSLLSE